jgi:hypothetical protein
MDGERAEAYLRRWERAGGLRGTMLNGMRSLVLICFYQQPRVLAAMEVDWQGRADRLTAARARLAASGAGTEA